MKHCPKCGALCPRPGQKFCGSCGAPLSQTPPQAGATWPPESVVRRKRTLILGGALALAVLLLVIAGAVFFLNRKDAQPTAGPGPETAETAVSGTTGAIEEADRLYLENLTAVKGMVLTADGVEIPYQVASDGRVYLDRARITRTDTLLRAIVPSGEGYQTSLALVSKPSNPTASFDSLTVCDKEGYNDPDGEYLDAMLTVYYRSQLRAFNSRKVEDLRFSTELNGQSWEGDITMGAYDAVEYDLDQSDMGFTTTGLAYGDHKVTFNAAGHWVGVNRNTGATESGTDYMTIQAIWRDGLWQVDRCLPCTEEEYNNGTLKLSTQ